MSRLGRGLRFALAGLVAAVSAAAPAAAQSLIRDTEIEAMIADWSHPIFIAAGQPPESIHIGLINDPTMNAFVTNGRRMFFHTGIILESERPLELKAVIAHETGHVAMNHVARISDGMRQATLPLALAIAAGIAAAAAGEGGAAAALIGSAPQFATLEFFDYTRTQESTADQAAVEYLERTGQSGEGLITFFSRFRDLEFRSVSSLSQINPYFRTHPISSDRIEALRAPVDRQVHRDVEDSAEDVERLRRAQAKIRAYLDDKPELVVDHYRDDDSVAGRYARAIAHNRVGGAADRTEGHALMDGLLDEEPENAYFWQTKAQMFTEAGRYEEALAPYREAVALMPQAPLFRLGLAETLIKVGGPEAEEEAVAHLIEAEKYEPSNPFLWELRARKAYEADQMALYHYARAEQRFQFNPPCARFHAGVAVRQLPSGPKRLRAADILSSQPGPPPPSLACAPRRASR